MPKLTTIASITCWYGKFPWYLPYFLHSCAFNPTIDFYIITDNKGKIDNKPENVKIIYKSLNQIKATASEKLRFKVNIDYPINFVILNLLMDFYFLKLLKIMIFGHKVILTSFLEIFACFSLKIF